MSKVLDKIPFTKAKNNENGDILYVVPNKPKRYIDGKEYICVKRENDANAEHYILRSVLTMNWK